MNMPLSERPPIRRALISVSDKTGIVSFARRLHDNGVDIISTGGTRRVLLDAGLACIDIADITGFAEILDGRVKTLHPNIHGALLARRDKPAHLRALADLGIAGIDLLVGNLYPFEQTLAAGADDEALNEAIDIGGPAMIRAAAKNHDHMTVVVDPEDYALVGDEISAHGGCQGATRHQLAAKAFALIAAYDVAIADWFAASSADAAAPWRGFCGTLAQRLRYGENPHQHAAFYRSADTRAGVATAQQVQGRALSYNNINDTDAAVELVAEFDADRTAAVAIVKHANPCGVAEAPSLTQAYEMALRCDPVSAFGGVVSLNRTLDAVTAERIGEIFTEVVIAPRADVDALAVLAEKKNLRVLLTGAMPDRRAPGTSVRSVAGGLLVQSRDNGTANDLDLKVVSARAPGEAERRDMLFAWRVVKHVKSNAIVFAKRGASVGIGAGQTSRVDAVHMAARKAAQAAKHAGLEQSLASGAVVASDAFFPFADGVLAAAEAGATAIIQPGGSKRDDAVIAAADKAGLAMIFTGMRHFRH